MKTFLHTRPAGSYDWLNTDEEFDQIPRVGEYISRSPTGGWFKVNLVVWVTTPGRDYDVEVYAVEVDAIKAERQANEAADREIAEGRV
jgi:hypothetical protein